VLQVTLEVALVDGFGDAALITEWDALAATDPFASVFQRARYLQRWDASFPAQRELRTRTFRRDGRLVGLACETRELLRLPSGPQQLVRFAGGSEVTDYLGPIATDADRADVAAAYVAALAADRDWDECTFGGLVEEADWHGLLATNAIALGLGVVEAQPEAVCPRVDLTGGIEAYLARLPGRFRQEAHRKARKLSRDVAPYEVFTFPVDRLAEGIEEFIEQATQSDAQKATFFRREEMRAWFLRLAEEYGPDGTLRVHRLDVGGLAAAMTVSLVDGGTSDAQAGVSWGLYNSSFDPSLAALAPGMVLVWELIGLAAAEGCVTFDLLRGDEPYKYRFGAVDRTLHTLTLVRG